MRNGEPAIAEARRIAELDGVRGIAILAVIIHHEFDAPLLWGGVDIFFVLSGFLITGILIRQKESGGPYFSYFYARRVRRLLVPYLLLLVVSSLLFGTAWMKHWYWFAFFAANIGTLLDQMGHVSLNPLWSLAVEEQFYFVWPIVVMGVRRNALLIVSLIILIATPILRGVATPWFDTRFPIYYLTPFRMDLLASGAILAWLHRWNRPWLDRLSYWPQVALFVIPGLVVFLSVIDPGFRTGANTVRGNVLIYEFMNMMATSLVVTALLGRGLICRFLRNPILRYIGTISYSMYLIHKTALLLAARVVPGRAATFTLGLAIRRPKQAKDVLIPAA
jgi:peptidoglycan/LPS O-acetylase OafA/YrhL